jgi:flagellar hook-associated protein 3 FlgL
MASLNGLQMNISRLGETQQQLSSGKLITRASDNPTGTVAAMQFRGEIAGLQQFDRNAADGLGWLSAAETALTSVSDDLTRTRGLALQGLSAGTFGSGAAREAIALEIDNIRESVISSANATYIDRPVFGGTTDGKAAYSPAGAYVGDAGTVERTVGTGTKVRVDVAGPQVFGENDQQVMKLLADVADHLRTDPSKVAADLDKLDIAGATIRGGLSKIGARSSQLEKIQSSSADRILELTGQLAEIEDIDLPKTITELTLQQTAYQAALAATAKVIQPSLVDFLR